MKVVLFHPAMLPPRDYGGVERVVVWLARGLIERGHSVWVGAHPGSTLPPGATLIPVSPEQPSAGGFLGMIPLGADVIHFMAPPEREVWGRLPCAGLLTVHGNGKPGETFPRNTVFLSTDHARRHRASAYVYNGIDPEEYEFNPGSKEDWHLFLSKTSWKVKNVKGAIRIARFAREKLKVAGGNRPILAHAHALLSRGVEWVGPVAGEGKARLLSRARSLVFPVLWPEPFGLVVVEALISGTPVLASPIGSLPELVSEKVGALIEPDNLESWARALHELRFDPEECRAYALSKFHYRVMAENYEKVYLQVAGGKAVQDHEPRTLNPKE